MEEHKIPTLTLTPDLDAAQPAAKEPDLLEKVIAAFQQQLDSLFENDVVDITAEIRVMEKMMASEGLAGTNDFK